MGSSPTIRTKYLSYYLPFFDGALLPNRFLQHDKLEASRYFYAPMAQQVARILGKDKVAGSSPARSSNALQRMRCRNAIQICRWLLAAPEETAIVGWSLRLVRPGGENKEKRLWNIKRLPRKGNRLSRVDVARMAVERHFLPDSTCSNRSGLSEKCQTAMKRIGAIPRFFMTDKSLKGCSYSLIRSLIEKRDGYAKTLKPLSYIQQLRFDAE